MRIATWNMKQAVAPKKPLPELWAWAEEVIDPDIAVFTEAKVTKDGVPDGWSAMWEYGIDRRKSWGTVVASRGVDFEPVETVKVGRKQVPLTKSLPGTTLVADVFRDGEWWATLVGLYAITQDPDGKSCGHGGYSLPRILRDLEPLFESDRGSRVVLAGDFNLWPRHVESRIAAYDLFDLIDVTGDLRAPLDRCANCKGDPECCHLWTHKNGNSPNAAVQQIDYILATDEMLDELVVVYGGVGDFTDAWDVSDHAPVVAEFD